MRLLMFAAVLLSLATPAIAQSAPPPQSETWAYCLVLEEGHPEKGICDEWFEQLTVAERRDFQEWRAEEDAGNWESIVEGYRLIAVERSGVTRTRRRTHTRRRTRDNAGVLLTIAAVGGLGGVGFVGGVFVGTGVCSVFYRTDDQDMTCLFVGGPAGAAVGALLGMYQGYRWARPNSSNGSSSRDVEQSDRQVSIAPYRHDDASGLMFSGQF